MPGSTDEYAEVLQSLYGLEASKGMDFKLERIERALTTLGEPHKKYPTIHIAGTNGKGSVAAMLHAIFAAAGYAVGLYTSPHLVSFTERIRVGNREIQATEVVDLYREVHAATAAQGLGLTFFEVVTVMAFLFFARQRVPLAVIETGLGGRLDATNVVEPELAVITTIGLDHQEFLGDTLESVAYEKAGIIKPSRLLIAGKMPAAAADVVGRIAAERRARTLWAGHNFRVCDDDGRLTFRGEGFRIDDFKVGLRGRHQRDNAALALAAAEALAHRFELSAAHMKAGLAQVKWPGRLEVVAKQPLVVLDGAHNADGVVALCDELPGIVDGRPVHLVFSVMRDKQWLPMVQRLAPIATSVTLTSVLPRRAELPENLLPHFSGCPFIEVVDEP
ncbi:MAG TPA: folylpolyglutamate synthase/dihydrofolate synthase family protein, partial [Candidatus Acidoferrales bacterium]|nr:folylpolyglutamate synthase/dihydrofolate synthase family protein [Candidatus Acidoferrales bacterium]